MSVTPTGEQAEIVYLEDFGKIMQEDVETLDNNGKTISMTCYDSLCKAVEVTQALHQRMKLALRLEGAELKNKVEQLGNELDILQRLGIKTLDLATFFQNNVAKLSLSEEYKNTYPVHALHVVRIRGWYTKISGEILWKHEQFSSYLGDRGTVSTYLMDTWSQLQEKSK